jgi:hypothetical protein
MNYCTYRIKEQGKDCWWHCQLKEGHDGDHKPPRSATGPHPVFEGIWHRPGEKSTADPEPPPNPAVMSVWGKH